ncbi:MAG: tetratricopeptide repeat protein [Luteitalea sp.]|nr:tetratricopeptide repeat protein [Luteitalea sp.]
MLVLLLYASVLRPGGGTDRADTSGVAAERWLVASREAFDAARYEDALQPTIELTRAFPNQQVYAEWLASIYQHLSRPADEAAAWERVVAISPTPVDACPALPDAYVRAAGHSDKSLAAFERCSAFEPNNTDMLFYLGRARERAGRTDLAEAAYRQAIGIDRNHNDSRLGLARLDLRAGRVEEAGHSAAAVLELYPNHTDALLVAGISAQRLGRLDDARRHLERAVGLAERDVDIHIALGILDFSEAHVADARRHFERAVQLEPARRAEVAVWLERTRSGR